MERTHKWMIVLLTVVATLLAINLAATLATGINAKPAYADIVSGKNYFTTHTPDGRTVFLWYYDYQGAPSADAQAFVKYLGRIDVSGQFERN